MSARAARMLKRVRAAAVAEVRSHLAAGREVHGIRDGKIVTIKPKT